MIKKIFIIFFIFCLSLCVFGAEKKDNAGPDILVMLIYENNSPSILNISYNRDVETDMLNMKLADLRRTFKGDFRVIPNDEKETRGITAIITNSPYKVGSGEVLEPIINTFCDEKEIAVLFTGQFEFIKNPLIMYEKDGFSIIAHIQDQAKSIQYEIKMNGKEMKVPKNQGLINVGKVIKKIVVWILGIGIVLAFIFVFRAMLMKSVKQERKRRKNSQGKKFEL